jgi:hypothetical protein
MTRHRPTLWALLVLTLAGAAGLAATSGHHVEAADHLDPPARTNPDMGGTDRNADIADVYAWHTGTGAAGRVTLVMSFSGPNAPSADQEMPCDRDVLYTIHLDTDDTDGFENATTHDTITVRFGADDLGNCFARVAGVPGMPAEGMPGSQMVVPVEVPTTRGDIDVYAGLRDDAFFFDLQGFRETVAALDDDPQPVPPDGIFMTADRDFFEGMNTPAIVIEFPLLAISPGNEPFRIWATTGRIGA